MSYVPGDQGRGWLLGVVVLGLWSYDGVAWGVVHGDPDPGGPTGGALGGPPLGAPPPIEPPPGAPLVGINGLGCAGSWL